MINQGNSLFKSNGDINTSTLLDLLNKVNDENVVNDENGNKVEAVNGVTYLTAKNFGQYGDQSSYTEAQKGNAQIILKLFEDSTNTENGVDSFTEQYWQAVFRSTDDEKDVLTLYMCFPYLIDVPFINSGNYDADYSNSSIRQVSYLFFFTHAKCVEDFSVKQICKNSYDKIKFVTQIYP